MGIGVGDILEGESTKPVTNWILEKRKRSEGGQNEGEINVFWQSIWKSPVNKTLSTSECC